MKATKLHNPPTALVQQYTCSIASATLKDQRIQKALAKNNYGHHYSVYNTIKAQNQCTEQSTFSQVEDQTIRLELAFHGLAHFTILYPNYLRH